MKRWIITCLLLIPLASSGQTNKRAKNYPPVLEGATTYTYKTIGEVELKLYAYSPGDHKVGDKRPVAIFFFGGGWNAGSPVQFKEHCRYLASRGMVGITADYRVKSRHDTPAVKCVEDAKSAIRWIRQHAEELGIDPDKVVAGGGSAGGHVAACTGVIAGFDAEGEDLSVSSRPDAMILFNPALVLAPVNSDLPKSWTAKYDTMQARMGVEPDKLSPFHHVAKDAPPCIIFHGEADTTVPFTTAQLFNQAMQKVGNDCQLVGYEGEPHGFFNFGRSKNVAFIKTLKQADHFLGKLGYLKGGNTVNTFVASEEK